MENPIKLAACLAVTLCAVMASAQLASTGDDATSAPSTSPAAYVYMISTLSNNTSELDAYSADSNGALTRLAGSPFWTSTSLYATGLANTAHWLFSSDGTYIYSFSIASNGTLKKVSSINAQQYTGTNYIQVESLFLDHTGSTLYALNTDGAGNLAIQFFKKNSTTGALTYFGTTTPGATLESFTGNNVYAYGASCVQLSAVWSAYSRSSNGTLSSLSIDPEIPTNPNGDYCPDGDAADPASDLAVAFLLEGAPPVQLGVYTADSFGNLTTKSTDQNMPTASVGYTHRLLASPAGNLLAVAGDKGLQVFYFNGSNPITSYTGLMAAHTIYDLSWDTHNHLYAIGSGKVNAFRVTTTGYKQASGSPYSINAVAITVLSK